MSAEENVPLCVNCTHFQAKPKAICNAPQRRTWSPVWGTRPTPLEAETARRSSDDCSPAGRWFSCRPSAGLVTLISGKPIVCL